MVDVNDENESKIIYINFKKKCKRRDNIVTATLKLFLTNIKLLIMNKVKYEDNVKYIDDYIDYNFLNLEIYNNYDED